MARSQREIDLHHLRLAHVVAGMSRDPSTQVGAIVLAADGRKLSSGYNGMVAGAPELEENWNDRERKYPRVIHAELNALLNCPFERVGATLYATMHPCAQCFKAILQCGIKRIVHYGPRWPRETQTDVINELLHLADVVQIDDDPVIEGIKALYAR